MVQRNLIGEAIEVRDNADHWFARALESKNPEMIKMWISLLQKADEKLLMIERQEREKQYRNIPMDKTHPENLGAEGMRQFLKLQYEGLTGIKIKDFGK